jgi:hypothetical protein
LRAHKKNGHGAIFICPVTKLKFVLSAVLFVDDCDLIHIDMEKEESVSQTFESMQASILSWGRLLIATGGSYKPEKCFYHLLSFQWDNKGKWKYAPNHEVAEYAMVFQCLMVVTLPLSIYRQLKYERHWVYGLPQTVIR